MIQARKLKEGKVYIAIFHAQPESELSIEQSTCLQTPTSMVLPDFRDVRSSNSDHLSFPSLDETCGLLDLKELLTILFKL